jgi:NitT/TauT family transport system ATP-binding protein
MELTDYLNYYPHQLSGGMRQRVALVRTLAINPYILLLDEPFSALDYITRLRLEDLVLDTLKKRNKTAILVTHDISEALAMSDRIIIMQSNPGHIKKVLQLPKTLRNELPFSSRKIPEFQEYFQLIWREMNENEGII